jgi:Mn-containing catalase
VGEREAMHELKFEQAIDAVRKAEVKLMAAMKSAENIAPDTTDTGSMLVELRRLRMVRENLTSIQFRGRVNV